MGRTQYIRELKKYLISKGYVNSCISERMVNLYGVVRSLVEVHSGTYVMQVFMLMSDDIRNMNSRYPIYKTYTQKTPKGNLIYPACCIACFNGQIWSFYNASETCESMSDDFVNYNKAVERFDRRLNLENLPTRIDKLRLRTSLCGLALIFYLTAYMFISRTIILNWESIVTMASAVLLFIIPDLLLVINKISINGIEVEINKGMI